MLDRFRWQAAALAVLILIAYANSLGSSFHFDDSAIFANSSIVKPGFGLDLFRLDQTRPLTYLTFHWNYLAGGEDPTLYHLVNLLLHCGNSILVLVLARRYFPALAAGCVALVFALHPLQTESVTYVFARSTLLSTHFALWTIWLYLREKYLPSALLFGVSLLAKEETVALPGFLLLLDAFERRRPKLGYYAALAGFAGLAAARLFYLIYSSPVEVGVGRSHGITTGNYLLTQCRMIWIYLRLLIAPVDLNLDRDERLSTGLLSPWTTLAGVVAIVTLGAVLIWLVWKKRSPSAVWALGYFVLLSPSSSVVTQDDLIFEHRTYLPMICMVIALGFLLARVPQANLMTAFAVLVPVMLAGTISRNADWHDERSFWTDITAKSPNKARSWLGLARVYWNDPEKGREYLTRGLAIDPNNAELHNNYGIVLLRANQTAQALEQFRRAMALAGESADRWNNVGGAYFRLNDVGASLDSFQRALKLDPCNFNARRNVMMIYSTRNNPHGVWLAGEIPGDCRMIPEQARELESLRRRAGTP